MELLITNATVIAMDKKKNIFKNCDVLVKDGKIERIGANLRNNTFAGKILDASNKLVVPGLINAHLHSDENYFRGKFDNLPLELWMLYSCPPLHYGPFGERLIYLRTMLGAIEMIKNGVTCVQDDVSECPAPSISGYDAVFRAYKDIGMKANVALNLSDQKYENKLPFTEEYFTEEIRNKLCNGDLSKETYLDIYKEIIKLWHNQYGMKVVVSSSAPQRCTKKYLHDLIELANHYDLPLHTHMLETKMQAITGYEFYGKSIVEYARDIGLLSKRLTIAHAIWLYPKDIQMLGEAGVYVVHNPISNLKLGSGVMPLHELLDAGVNVTLGTDGTSSNDSQNMFEVMKFTALLHKLSSPDFRKWPTSNSVLDMVTNVAAGSTMRSSELGSLEIGKSADMIIIDLNNPTFLPVNDYYNQLVYCENGRSVETVIINGKIVMENRKITGINELEILQEIHENSQGMLNSFNDTIEENSKLFPYIEKIYWTSVQKEIGINRWLGSDRSN